MVLAQIVIAVFGSLTVIVMAIIGIPFISSLGFITANNSANLVSTSAELSKALPLIAVLIVVGVFGFILERARGN